MTVDDNWPTHEIQRTKLSDWNGEEIIKRIEHELTAQHLIGMATDNPELSSLNPRQQAESALYLATRWFILFNVLESTGQQAIAAATYVVLDTALDEVVNLLVHAHGKDAVAESLAKND